MELTGPTSRDYELMFRHLLPSTRRLTTPFRSTYSTMALQKPCKFALIQLATGPSKDANLASAKTHVTAAAQNGADVVVLPECFNSPYGTQHFPKYAEPIPARASDASAATPSYNLLSALAKDLKIHLIAGSIPELECGTKKLYNTCMIFAPSGALLAAHRKVHLFDIDIPGKITFRESEVLTGGSAATVVDIEGFGKVGVAICYDVRFPELAMMAARQGAFAMVYPGAFNTTTGPLHWELLARARAVDNQIYVGMCSPARGEEGYQAWGESMVVDPNGEVQAKLDEKEGVVEWVCQPERVAEVRKNIPVGGQRRFDVYADVGREGPSEKSRM